MLFGRRRPRSQEYGRPRWSSRLSVTTLLVAATVLALWALVDRAVDQATESTAGDAVAGDAAGSAAGNGTASDGPGDAAQAGSGASAEQAAPGDAADLDVGSDSFTELKLDDGGVPVHGQSAGVLETPDGWVLPILKTTETGWIVWTPCARAAEATQGTVVGRADFVIDAGHGGSETGAVGPGGLVEAELNLAVASEVRDRLQDAGYVAVLTRTRDVRVPIATRAEIAHALRPRAFISIHFNGGADAPSSRPGTEMYHQIGSADSRRLAGLLYEETLRVLEPYQASWVALADAGVLVRPNREGSDFYGVLRRPVPVTSVLAEYGYLTNAAEERLYARPEVQEALAGATVRAVDRFVNSSDPGSGFVAEEDMIFKGYGDSGTGRTDNCTDPELR